MHENWLKPGNGHGSANDIWAVDYTAHPLLDPDFTTQRSRMLDLAGQAYGRIRSDNEAYREALARLFRSRYPHDQDIETLAELKERVTEYFLEADIYLASAIDLLPIASRHTVTPLAEVSACHDLRELMGLTLEAENERLRYEACRKIFLARTLLQIDQSRVIQDGERHRSWFENILNDGLWCHTRQVHDLSIGFHVNENGTDINYTSRPGTEDRRLDFRSTFLEKTRGGRTISLDVLYYNCRFKRSVTPISLEVVDGIERVVERSRWSDMRTASSGSILSKMIRKGINNPDEIGDIIGSMFIVNDLEALDDLILLLDDCFGAPFGWRNVTDTLAGSARGPALNDYSSAAFRVLKGDVDILYNEGGCLPYRFPVEVQIYTLEGYLRTVCGRHEASHRALKLRQFLFGLVPKIFPRQVYGADWLKLEAAARCD